MSKGRKSLTTRINVRLTGEMRRQLEESGAQNGISLQAEIVRRLDQSLKGEDQLQRRLKALEVRMEHLEQLDMYVWPKK